MGSNDSKPSINFLRGVPAEEALARLIPRIAAGYEKAVTRYGTDVLQYGHFSGFKPLREIIGRRHGVDPQRVIVGNGGLEVISLFFKSLPLQSHIVVEALTYDRVLADAKRYGHRVSGVRLTAGGIDLDQFTSLVEQSSVTAFYGIPFHHNPTGINYTVENRRAVERICADHRIFCVWDICYQDLRYDGMPNDGISVADGGPILTSSFTKTISPGTKCGYMIVPEHYVDHLTQVIANTRINPNLPTQAFIADFIGSGDYAKYVEELRQLYRPPMDALNVAMHSHFPGALPADITGGFFAPLVIEGIAPDRQADFIDAAKTAGVNIAPGWAAVAPGFEKEIQQKGLFIRLTFPAYAADRVAWGVGRLKETLNAFVR